MKKYIKVNYAQLVGMTKHIISIGPVFTRDTAEAVVDNILYRLNIGVDDKGFYKTNSKKQVSIPYRFVDPDNLQQSYEEMEKDAQAIRDLGETLMNEHVLNVIKLK